MQKPEDTTSGAVGSPLDGKVRPAALSDYEFLRLARHTLEQGLCFDRQAKITRATDAELCSFARALFQIMVEDACERIGVHSESSRQAAKLRAALNAGADDATLGALARVVLRA